MNNWLKHTSKHLTFSLLILTTVFVSCNNSEPSVSANAQLNFSEKKVEFDTILTKTGSITRYLKVFNTENKNILINEIFLANGDNSEFIINVNGNSANYFQNVEIAPHDSIFIFIQAKLNENSVDTLIFHEDSIAFIYNNRPDYISLTAWGQDVEKHRGEVHDDITFSAGKPHVIIDSLVINEGGSLTLEPGARLLLHYGADIIVHGKLNIQGSFDKQIVISSDRLEETYAMLPGQWGSIIIEKECPSVSINYATIKNGVNGLLIHADKTTQPEITISNSHIQNMSANVVWAENCNISSYNTVFANGSNAILNLQGGKHIFNHVTIYNNPITSRTGEPTLRITDFLISNEASVPFTSAEFNNSIIVGKYSNEISVESSSNTNMDVTFNYCLIKHKIATEEEKYFNTYYVFNKDKNLFVSDNNFNYMLDTLSQAQNIGNFEIAQNFELDLLENSRIIDEKPDVGAYEYLYIEDAEK